MAALLGYNLAFKVDGKTFAGRTQDDFNLTPTVKESITKDDQGTKRRQVSGYDATFSCQGVVELTTTGTNVLTRDEIVAMALTKGSSSIIPFSYSAPGAKALTGNCVITGYSESSNSEDEATYSLNFQVSGDITQASTATS